MQASDGGSQLQGEGAMPAYLIFWFFFLNKKPQNKTKQMHVIRAKNKQNKTKKNPKNVC